MEQKSPEVLTTVASFRPKKENNNEYMKLTRKCQEFPSFVLSSLFCLKDYSYIFYNPKF